MASDAALSLANLVSINVGEEDVLASANEFDVQKWKWSYTFINSDQFDHMPFLNGHCWDHFSRRYFNEHNIDFDIFLRQLGIWNITTDVFAGDGRDTTYPKSALLASGLFHSLVTATGHPKIPIELRLFIKLFHHIWIPSAEVDELSNPVNGTMMSSKLQTEIRSIFGPVTRYHGSLNLEYQPMVVYA